MGWCSATDIFDPVAAFVLSTDRPDAEKRAVLEILIGALEEGDWDCQQDSAYYDNPIVQQIMRDTHPRWFDED